MFARTQTRFHDVRVRLENYSPRTPAGRFLWEFFLFGFKQGWACLFGGAILGLLLATKWWWPRDAIFARYDFLFLAVLAIQALLLLLRMETLREAKIILIFHVIGTVMELFKTGVGSWTYPEPSFFASVTCRCFPASCMRRSAVIWRASPAFWTCAMRATRAAG